MDCVTLIQRAKEAGIVVREENGGLHIIDGIKDRNLNALLQVHRDDVIRVLRGEDKPPTKAAPTLREAALAYLEQIKSGKEMLVSLGIPELDYALAGGVAPGELVVVGALTSHGKSAFALQCMIVAAEGGMPGVIISEEMSVLAIGKRTIQHVSTQPEEHWKVASGAVERDIARLAGYKNVWIHEACQNAAHVVEVVRRRVKEHGVQIVAVDYAQLLQAPGKNRYEIVTNVSVAMRQLASETGCLVLMLCQLNREIEKRQVFMPKRSDLRESGQIEQDADVILFLVWPHMVDRTKPPHDYQIYVSKNRHRAINQHVVHCHFNPSRQMISEQKHFRGGADQGRFAEFDAYAGGEF